MKNLIGQILLDQFRVESFIASGGMGAVYHVWDLKRHVPLAMKVLHVDLAEDPSVLKRFRREARALKKLAHPNIVAFYGLHHTPLFSFLLEDHVDGPTLREVLRHRQGKALSVKDSLVYLKALSAALGYAHVNGVVHCDVKPGNVMIDQGGQIYLTDFGIARHAESAVTTLGVAGSPGYMAPEQIRGEPVSPATDVYALGVLLFEMLTGQRPFRGDEEGAASFGTTAAERVRYAHLNLAPPNPSHLNLEIPQALSRVILKALSKEPRDRYQAVSQMLAEAISAANMQADEIPARIDENTYYKLQELWMPPAHAIAGKEEVFEVRLEADSQVPALSAPKRKPGWLSIRMGLTLAAAGGGLFLIFALFNSNRNTISPPVETVTRITESILHQDDERQQATAIPTLIPPTSTATRRPTNTIKPLTNTPVPRISTPLPPRPTSPPISPRFTTAENMYCRDGPGSSFEAHTTILEGQSLPVLRRWADSPWLLVGIDREDTRTKCCWIGGEGSLNVEHASIPLISFLPDRIKCDLNL